MIKAPSRAREGAFYIQPSQEWRFNPSTKALQIFNRARPCASGTKQCHQIHWWRYPKISAPPEIRLNFRRTQLLLCIEKSAGFFDA